MKPIDLIIIVLVLAIVGIVMRYIHQSKKKGVKCIGCPEGAKCAGNCSGCSEGAKCTGNCSGCSGNCSCH